MSETNANTAAPNGLEAIYLAGSYYLGLLVKIDCFGHANVVGDNGAGKTTTLQLIPALYGINPESMVKKVGDKLSFLDHYLPNQGSVLIFQYRRDDETCCALMYRHSAGSKIAYRFMSGRADDILFAEPWLSKFKSGQPVTETFAEMMSQGIEISNQLSQINEYRAVIQQDRHLIKQLKSKSNALLHMARKYGIGGTDGEMTQMDHLTFAVLKRDKMFGRMKDMIINTQFTSHVPAKPKHIDNKQVADDLASLRDFSNHQGSLRECVAKHRERHEMQKEIDQLALALKAAKPALVTSAEEIEGNLSLLSENKRESKEQFEEAANAYGESSSNLGGQLSGLNSQIETIHEDKSHWDDQAINTKQAEFEQLGTFFEKYEAAEDYLNGLTEIVTNEKNWRLEQIQKRNETTAKQLTPIQTELQSLDKEAHKVDSNYTENGERINSNAAAEKEAAFKEYDPRKNQLLADNTEQTTLSKAGGETEEEALQKAEADGKREQAEWVSEDNETKLEGCQDIYEQACKQHSSAITDLNASLEAELARQAEVDTVRRQLYPEDNSLLAFLRRENPNWAEDIGKVINPDLLHRKSLRPEYQNTGGEVFGLSLDLDAVEIQDCAVAEDRLQGQLQEADEMLAKAESHRLTQEKNVTRCSKTMKDKQTEVRVATVAFKSAKSSLEIARQHAKEVKDSVQQAIYDRRQKAKARAATISSEALQLEQAYFDQLTAIEFSATNAKSEALSKKGIELFDIDERKGLLTSNIQSINDDQTVRLKEIERTYKSRCKNMGVDEDVITDAEKRLSSARKNHDRIKGYREPVADYKGWMSRSWNRLPVLQEKLGRLEASKTTMNAEFNTAKSQHKAAMDQYKRKSTDLSAQLIAIKTKITSINEVLSEVGAIPNIQRSEACPDVEFTVKLLRDHLHSNTQLKKQVLIAVKKATNLITQRTSSKISEMWSALYSARLQNIRGINGSVTEFDDLFLLQLPEDLEHLLDKGVPEIRKALVVIVRSLGDQIDNYYRDLQQIDREVTTVSKLLDAKINTGQKIPALSEIKIHLLSRIDQTGGWAELKAFNQTWETWGLIERNELPPPEFDKALDDVVTILEKSHVSNEMDSLIDMVISFKENGRRTDVRSDSALNDSSSNGLSFLAVLVIFIGLARYLCPNKNVRLTWPVDELGTLSLQNIPRVFSMLDDNNISMFGAMPTTDRNLIKHFKHRILLDKDKGAMKIAETPAQANRFKAMIAANNLEVTANA